MQIPDSVLEVLKNEWDPTDYSAFDSVFNDQDDRGRRADPSFYHIANGKQVETSFDTFSYDEARSMIEEKVFGSMAVVTDTGLVINEHAQHALEDFMHDVYVAWEKYKGRLNEVERVSLRPG